MVSGNAPSGDMAVRGLHAEGCLSDLANPLPNADIDGKTPEILPTAALQLVRQHRSDALLPLQSYTNHDIVRFLESIGAEFGACQNAHTSFDETVYELLLPAEDLAKGLSVFAEFASKIRQVALYTSPQRSGK